MARPEWVAAARIWHCGAKAAAQKRDMRTLGILLVAFLVPVAVMAGDFTQTMTAEEREAAGLGKLTPAELARLTAAVERYKSGEVGAVQQEAERKVAAAEAKVKESEAKATASRKSGPSWLGALIALDRAEKNAGPSEDLHTRLEGTIKTFSGRRNFKLANGQVWQMVEAGSYAGPVYQNPEVIIRPGVLGTFWLNIPDAALRVKVKPVKLE